MGWERWPLRIELCTGAGSGVVSWQVLLACRLLTTVYEALQSLCKNQKKALLREGIVKGTLWEDASPPWGTTECPCAVLTWPALQGGPMYHPASLSSLIWCPLSIVALPHPTHSSHTRPMSLFKMLIGTLHPSVQNPLMESLMAVHATSKPPVSCRSGPS